MGEDTKLLDDDVTDTRRYQQIRNLDTKTYQTRHTYIYIYIINFEVMLYGFISQCTYVDKGRKYGK